MSLVKRQDADQLLRQHMNINRLTLHSSQERPEGLLLLSAHSPRDPNKQHNQIKVMVLAFS